MKDKLISILAVFGSTSTLICCVLPAVVATLAGGAAVGSMLTLFPWLIPLSQHKIWIFFIAGLLIIVNGTIVLRSQSKLVCSLTGGKDCKVLGSFSRYAFWISVVIYSIGFGFSYLYRPLLKILS